VGRNLRNALPNISCLNVPDLTDMICFFHFRIDLHSRIEKNSTKLKLTPLLGRVLQTIKIRCLFCQFVLLGNIGRVFKTTSAFVTFVILLVVRVCDKWTIPLLPN